jgi:DNA-binding transcriptional ArsR family regulator
MPKRSAELGLAEAALMFAALGDETRLALLQQLSASGPASISTLAENFRITRQAVTKHLQSLASAGMIDGERRGREHVWAFNPDRFADAQRSLEVIARGWDDALNRLKTQIEES